MDKISSGFRGVHRNCEYSVERIDAEGARAFPPPEGARFRWGDMSESTGNLATAIATALYPADVLLPDGHLERAARLIHAHFLTEIHKHASWELDDATVLAYLTERFPSLASVEAAA